MSEVDRELDHPKGEHGVEIFVDEVGGLAEGHQYAAERAHLWILHERKLEEALDRSRSYPALEIVVFLANVLDGWHFREGHVEHLEAFERRSDGQRHISSKQLQRHLESVGLGAVRF